MYYYYIIIVLIAVLAGCTRFFRLGKWSLWEDELFTIRHAAAIAKGGVRAIDNSHPLYYLSIVPIINHFGINEWSVRSVAAIVGTLSVPILIFTLQPIIGTVIALIFGALLAISPWHVYWSQNARFYSMTFLLQLLALGNLYLWTVQQDWMRLALFLALYALSVLAHETSALALLVGAAYLLLISLTPTTAISISALLMAFGALAVAALYTALVFLFLGGGFRKRKSKINSHWKVHYSRRRSGPLRVLGGILKFVGIATVCSALVWLASNYTAFGRFEILVFTLITVPLGVVTVGAFVAYSTTRYAFLSLGGFLLAASQLLSQLWLSNQLAAAIIGTIFVATALDDLALYYSAQNGNRERWREVLLKMKARIDPTDRVLTTAPDLAIHYLERPARWLTEFDCKMLDELNGVNWFVVNDAIQSLPKQVQSWIEQNTTLIFTDEVHFHLKSWNISVRRYEKRA